MQVILENVRSFCDREVVPLRPLTLLVGENSSGKTTFLSCVSHVQQPEFPSIRPSFNVPPFDLGTYDSIATYKGGRFGRSDSFSVGLSEKRGNEERELIATYSNYKGQPQASRIFARGAPGEIELAVFPESHRIKASMKSPLGERIEFDMDWARALSIGQDAPVGILLRYALTDTAQKQRKADQQVPIPQILEFMRLLQPTARPIFALAPVRTKPRRTYDELNADFDPEGDHVPVLLARLWQGEDQAQKSRVFDALSEFGKSAGLFRQIGVRPLGNRPSDPFQIQVTVAGPSANLPDVGYGISQALPIVVQSVLSEKNVLLLLQQPEVHLHPRGQAALGSLFVRLVSKERKQLVVETHSDYLLDRVRLEVSRGSISASDVLILFFEKEALETKIYQIEVDEHGNISGAPESYRQFFLEEELSLFSRASE
jgi:AAA ATPase domain/AAA domain/Protein of unknown function (DUF3696)